MNTDKVKPLTKGVRTHVILMQRKGRDQRPPKFAGYAIDGQVKRNGKLIPVEEWVETLNASKKGHRFSARKVRKHSDLEMERMKAWEE